MTSHSRLVAGIALATAVGLTMVPTGAAGNPAATPAPSSVDELRTLGDSPAGLANLDTRGTALPTATQRAAADSAVRGYADEVSRGAGDAWRRSIRAAARSREAGLPDALDQAVARARFPGRSAWWFLFDAVQWLALAGTVAGLAWLLGLAAADYFRIALPPPPTVAGSPVPVPTLLVVTGVVLAVFTALSGALLAAVASRLVAARLRRRLRESVRAAAREEVETPVRAELAAHRRFTEALARATAP